MNKSLFLEPYKSLESRNYELTLVTGYRGFQVKLTQLSSGKCAFLPTLSVNFIHYLQYLESPFNPCSIKKTLDTFFAVSDPRKLANFGAIVDFFHSTIVANINQGALSYDLAGGVAFYKNHTPGIRGERLQNPLIKTFCSQAYSGIFDHSLYNFLNDYFSTPLAAQLHDLGELHLLDDQLTSDTLVTSSGHIALYVITDLQGYVLAEDGTPTMYSLNRQEAVYLPSTRLYTAGKVAIQDCNTQSVWKVLVGARDITIVNTRREIYVDRFIPVKEVSTFKDMALSYNVSAERIASFLKKVPTSALPKADYIPPEPCYWGIEYYDDRNKEPTVSS